MGMQHMIQYFPRILRKQIPLEFIINCKKRISTNPNYNLSLNGRDVQLKRSDCINDNHRCSEQLMLHLRGPAFACFYTKGSYLRDTNNRASCRRKYHL